MKVLVACEYSGRVRDAFIARGHTAISCDLVATENPGPHIIGDVRGVLANGWDMMIAHPPCKYLTRAGAQYWNESAWMAGQIEALAFVLELWAAPIERVAIENPVGRLNQLWRYPDDVIQPSMFGEPYTKKTCLWLRGLPPLLNTCNVLNPVKNWTELVCVHSMRARSRTFMGIAAAMAQQWS